MSNFHGRVSMMSASEEEKRSLRKWRSRGLNYIYKTRLSKGQNSNGGSWGLNFTGVLA